MPNAGVADPAEQFMQKEAPELFENCPGPHCWQSVWVVALLNHPAPHSVHVEAASSLYSPGAHSTQAVDPLGNEEYQPAAQVLQTLV